MRHLAPWFTLVLSVAGPVCGVSSASAQEGNEAELFGEGGFSTGANEYNPSLSPDGRTLVFARSEPDFRNARILVSHLRDGRWTAAEPISFTDPRFSDSDPTFAPDGQSLFFVSDRPAAGRDPGRADLDLWRARRAGDGWGDPEHLGDAVNSRAQELGPSWHDGWLYFSSSRGGRARMLDLFRAPEGAAGFGAAEALAQWNTEASESDPELSADGRTLIFWSDRSGARGGGDVYVSRRTGDGWSDPRPMAGSINSAGFDFTPTFSPDGRWIYFASTRGPVAGARAVPDGQADLYRIPRRAVLP